MVRIVLFALAILPLFIGCSSKQEVDLVFINGSIYSFGPEFSMSSCLVIHQGKVLASGSSDSLLRGYHSKNIIDLQGKHIYPAWHDAHAHFAAMGKGLLEVDLRGKQSWNACLQSIQLYIEDNPDRKWILGRGWDQNLWGGIYPDRQALDSLYPEIHFYLSRVDGHAALVSANVLEELGFDTSTKIEGGQLLRDSSQVHRLTGLLIDAAKDMASTLIPEPGASEWRSALLRAQEICIPYGIAAITEAGLSLDMVQIIDSMQKEGLLHMKFIAMLNPGIREFVFAENGIYETPKLKVASFKLYADGALGSRGALLKTPYCDHSGRGLAIHNPHYFDSICQKIYALGYQANTHCIGDSANRLILETYGKYLRGVNDRRWRIEHAQVMDLADIHFFTDYSIIPSVQPTHATSDMPWAEQRLCSARMPGAYAYKTLLHAASCLPLGTDFPVEEVNPMYTLVSAVYRVNTLLKPEGGFQNKESLSSLEALRGMTWWPAWAGFKESQFGALVPGMDADFVIYTQDLMQSTPETLVQIRPESTWIDGVRRWPLNSSTPN